MGSNPVHDCRSHFVAVNVLITAMIFSRVNILSAVQMTFVYSMLQKLYGERIFLLGIDD